MYSKNINITEITRFLNNENISTPMEYAKQKGTDGNYNVGTGKWITSEQVFVVSKDDIRIRYFTKIKVDL